MDTAKMQATAMTKVLERLDLTPETIAKTFKDIRESPEKLRALLNLWFVPLAKQSFVPDRDYAVSGLRDVEFLATAESPPGQLPYRMFDIETGNLVEFPAIGVRGQYCMLSHRWKGVELSLGYIKEARKNALERAREAVKAGQPARAGVRMSDVELVLEQCRMDLEEQEGLINELQLSGTTGRVSVAELLDRRLKVRAAEDGLGWAKSNEDRARSKLRFAEMERRIFSHLVGQIEEQVDEKMRGVIAGTTDIVETSARPPVPNEAGNEVVDEVNAEAKKAKDALLAAQKQHTALQDEIHLFQQDFHLRDALDEMINRLQRWKSAIKLQKSIQQADHIFMTKLFQHREKCYLWTDTCCIDKTNGGELSESLSLMGDWYASAEYALVQLDTKFSEADASKDWRRFEAERNANGATEAPKPNIKSFEEIGGSGPEWSTRAWTLQELVMSKTTFYTNSEWAPLSRPVESLGYFYYLIPFIALYTRGDTRNIYGSARARQGFWDVEKIKKVLGDYEVPPELKESSHHIEGSHAATSEAARVETAQQLIILLDALGVRVSKEMTMETATSEVARAVYLASVDLARVNGDNENQRALFLSVQDYLPSPDLGSLDPDLSTEEREEELAQNTINFLLQCLIAETEELVLADRKYVAEFGQVQQLAAWQQGTSRTGFSAQSVLEVSGKRWATVATDRAYALMGVLGVRFPTFSAEGYAKALARLLDEVVISRNDVSVFNWTGMEMGSPIRGRSMYPSSHMAYGNQEDRGKRYNLLLSAQVQDKMDDVMVTYHGIIQTLRNAIDFLKDKERKNLPLNWVERIVQFILQTSFRKLKHRQDGFGKIVGYIKEHCGKDKPLPVKKEARTAESASSATKGFSIPKRPTMPSLPSPSLSFPSFKSSAAKEVEGSGASTKKGSKFSGFGKGIKTPSFGTSKKATDPDIAVTPQSPAPTETIPDPPPAYEELQPPPTKPTWEQYDREVMAYLSSTADEITETSLPPELQAIKFELSDSGRPTAHSFSSYSPQGQAFDNISPNPIIINSSGIEGLFDIQRVIVTMIDPEKLRRQIAKAASPHDKISGWCSISTGFARVIASFACERQILEHELDVIETVEARVLREQDKEKGEKRGARLRKTLTVTKAGIQKAAKDGIQPAAAAAVGLDAPGVVYPEYPEGEAPFETEEPDTNDSDSSGNTDEERLVSRMIDFIQEPELQLVAGEWVLARFSGAPGANWFLCHLELGPVPGQFYGHRIAAGAIDFSDSTPEPGLVNAWQTYMDRKKRKMCYILAEYLKSRTTAKEGEERLKTGSDLAWQGLDMAFKGVGVGGMGLGSPGAGKSAAGEDGGKEKETEQGGGDDSESDSEEGDGSVSLLDKVLGQGKLAARAFGEYTVLAVAEKLFEMHADHLDKKLATSVLKRTPKSLRTAVENMNDNKSFLPAMFHSSTRVHMF